MIGSELLLGQIEDTNATHMARVFAENGIGLYQKTTIGDNRERICAALNAALDRADAVVCSGGLGPTEDDITRECIAEVLDRPLEYHEELFDQIKALFARYKLKITDNNRKQAYVPQGGRVIENPRGTAPGLIVESDRGVVICMPGVPHELKNMLSRDVVPYLRNRFNLTGLIHFRVLKVCGVGESIVDDAIGDLMNSQSNPTVGVLANPASVRIRIAARASSIAEADALIDVVDAQIRERLPGLVMGVNEDTLEGVVDQMLADRGWNLAVLETMTGGMIGQRLTAEDATQFVGGRIYPVGHFGGEKGRKTALDKTRDLMIEYAATCGLGVVDDPAAESAVVMFICPEGTVEWEFGRAGRDTRMQVRTSVVALEHVRRHLAAL